MYRISKTELVHAQLALLIAILLQVFVWNIHAQLALLPQFFIAAEIVMAVLLFFTANIHTTHARSLHHSAALLLIGLISAANFSSLVYMLDYLIFGHALLAGPELLISAMAIFATNIIVYGLWYWEIDSPGLTRTRWSRHDKDFHFIQQNMRKDFPRWQPEFFDYLYLSITNAVNFAPADTKPLTRSAKMLMASQAIISVLTLALVIARSVSILS